MISYVMSYHFIIIIMYTLKGVSYFVYGEKIDIYSGADSIQQEFIDAGVNYIRSAADIVYALPLYKLYPTKAYKDYEKIVRRLQRAGMVIGNYVV